MSMESIGSRDISGYVNATKAAEPGAQCAAMCTPPYHTMWQTTIYHTIQYHTGRYDAADEQEDQQAVLGGRSLPPAGNHLPTNVISPQWGIIEELKCRKSGSKMPQMNPTQPDVLWWWELMQMMISVKKNTAISMAGRLVKQYFKADVNQYNNPKIVIPWLLFLGRGIFQQGKIGR